MKILLQKNLTLTAVIGLAYWFFGNLYEEIVISPNWITDSPAQMKRLNEFFINTSPTVYFVPLTQIATILVWILFATNKTNEVRREYRIASIFAVLSTAINIVIVSTIVLTLFGADYAAKADMLNAYCWRWNILNIVRMTLVATTTFYMFNAYRKLDKL